MRDHADDILPDHGSLTQLQRLNRERAPRPIVTRREITLSEQGLSFLLTAEEVYDPYANPYGDE
jgi:hypothetical protein